jgi:hypothetical protein
MSERPLQHPERLDAELKALRQRMQTDLRVSPPESEVRVYVFATRVRYESFVRAYIPTLSARDVARHGVYLLRKGVPHIFLLDSEAKKGTGPICRAGPSGASHPGAPGDLSSFSFAESLRHELVHVTLNAVCPNLPIWLDEGLATYYESSDNAAWRTDLAARVVRAQSGPWDADLGRLERRDRMQQMGPLDYAESWSWVHWLLNGPPPVQEVFGKYLADLRLDPTARGLDDRLRQLGSDPTRSWAEHFRNNHSLVRNPRGHPRAGGLFGAPVRNRRG